MMRQTNNGYFSAIVAGVLANVILGASSLYWKLLHALPSTTVLIYRIAVSFFTLMLLMSLVGCYRQSLKTITKNTLLIHFTAAVLVVINWGVFIWAAIHGHVVESGIGYLVAPFVAIAVGILMYKDPVNSVQIIAIVIIVLAIMGMLNASDELLHWVYLTIGITWGGYACLKKMTKLDSFAGLFLETSILTLCTPLVIAMSAISISLPDSLSVLETVLLLACGMVTIIPLWLFSFASKRLPLSQMGFFQFVLPSTQLIVALTIYKQSISYNTLMCFLIIWFALLLIVAAPLFRAYINKRNREETSCKDSI